jgi:hypothetical protein
MENTEESANRARRFIYDKSVDFSQAKANRIYIEQYLKSKLALLMSESSETTMSGKEMDAKKHQDYLNLLFGLKEAVAIEEELKWKLISAQLAVEIYRTESANNRATDRGMA